MYDKLLDLVGKQIQEIVPKPVNNLVFFILKEDGVGNLTYEGTDTQSSLSRSEKARAAWNALASIEMPLDQTIVTKKMQREMPLTVGSLGDYFPSGGDFLNPAQEQEFNILQGILDVKNDKYLSIPLGQTNGAIHIAFPKDYFNDLNQKDAQNYLLDSVKSYPFS